MSLMEGLIRLDRVDSQLRGLRSRLDSAERYLKIKARQLELAKEQAQELETRKKQLQAQAGNFETESATLDARIDKLRDELSNTATNKQYTALLTEVNVIKAEREKIDGSALEKMTEVETTTASLTDAQAKVAEEEQLAEKAVAQRDERKAEIADRLKELEREREAAASALPDAALSSFNQAADLHEGEAMAQIEEVNRRNRQYACGACNMHVPFQLVAELCGPVDRVVTCKSCQRLLYMAEDLRGALAPSGG